MPIHFQVDSLPQDHFRRHAWTPHLASNAVCGAYLVEASYLILIMLSPSAFLVHALSKRSPLCDSLAIDLLLTLAHHASIAHGFEFQIEFESICFAVNQGWEEI
jgi:hypothetical protein